MSPGTWKTKTLATALFMTSALMTGSAVGLGSPPPAGVVETGVVNVYSGRHYGHMEPVFTQFTEKTGIEVRFSFGSDAALRARLKAEGRHTPADIYLGVDVGNLWLAAEDGLFQPLQSAVLEANVPATKRDLESGWTGLTKRVRTIMYHPDRVNPDELSTYEALADPKWRDRLCMRPATHVYTQSLVASLIDAHGVSGAEEIVSGWVKNNLTLIDSDTRILETVAAGGCDVAIANHYYMGRLLDADPQFPVRVFWANQGQGERGVHVNFSGAGVLKYARNQDNAIKLLEWLSGTVGQPLFADGNHEYPVNPDVPPHPIIAAFGDFKIDPIDIVKYGRLQAEAIRLLDRAGYR